MLTYNTHKEEVEAIQNIINSGRFFSITFIKKDGTIRPVSGQKKIYNSISPDTEKRGKFDRLEKDILLVWDTNKKIVDKEGNEKRGMYVSAKLPQILFFKSGKFVKDYTEENKDAITNANITPEQIQIIKSKMKIHNIIDDEIQTYVDEQLN